MTDEKHMPGPFRADEYDADERFIPIMAGAPGSIDEHIVAAVPIGYFEDDIEKATEVARLLAAAPAMFEALKEAKAWAAKASAEGSIFATRAYEKSEHALAAAREEGRHDGISHEDA